MPVEKLFKNCHIKSEFDLLLKNENKKTKKEKKRKYKPDGNTFVSKSKYCHQLLPKKRGARLYNNLVLSPTPEYI